MRLKAQLNTIVPFLLAQDEATAIFPPTIMQSLPSSSAQLAVTLPIPTGSFLSPGAIITITITDVTVSSPAEVAGTAAAISATDGSVQVPVADEVANIAVGFTPQSLIASVNEC